MENEKNELEQNIVEENSELEQENSTEPNQNPENNNDEGTTQGDAGRNFWDFDPTVKENEKSKEEVKEILEKKKWGWQAIMAYLLIPQIIMMFTYWGYGSPSLDTDEYLMVIGIAQLVSLPLILGIVLYFCKDVLPNFMSTFKTEEKDKKRALEMKSALAENSYQSFWLKIKDQSLFIYSKLKYVIVFLFMFGVYYLLVVIFNSITMAIPFPESGNQDNQEVVERLINMSPAMGFFLVVVAAPITEELFARYGIFNVVESKGTAATMSILLFAGMHVFTTALNTRDAWELLKIFPYFAGSIAFTAVYMMSDYKITYPILLHSLTNLIAYILIVTAGSSSDSVSEILKLVSV